MARCGEEIGVNLAVSLHAVTKEIRDEIVPLNKKYGIEELLQACADYPGASNARRITFEYVMLKDKNDSDEHAHELVRLLKLYYYVVVEHVRSNEGFYAWSASNAMVDRLATSAERAEFAEEFGCDAERTGRVPRTRPGGVQPRTASGALGRTHDPTRAKALLVLLWLRMLIERMARPARPAARTLATSRSTKVS